MKFQMKFENFNECVRMHSFANITFTFSIIKVHAKKRKMSILNRIKRFFKQLSLRNWKRYQIKVQAKFQIQMKWSAFLISLTWIWLRNWKTISNYFDIFIDYWRLEIRVEAKHCIIFLVETRHPSDAKFRSDRITRVLFLYVLSIFINNRGRS